MKDIPVFDTETGVSSLLLKEIPYKKIAYVKVHSVQPGGLRDHLRECVSFCRMCDAERVYASGHEELRGWQHHCDVLPMALALTERPEPEANLFPVTQETVTQWRKIYNEKMAPVDNAATMTAFDEKEICAGGAYFVHDAGELLGIGWLKDGELLCIASVKPGAGERVLKTLLTTVDTDRVKLEVASTNTPAIKLYKKLGFIQNGEARSWYTIFQGGDPK